MKGKKVKVTKNRGNCGSKLAKAFFGISILIAALLVISAIVVSFDKFLEVAIPVLVFITGICWALRTANVHQYKMTERNMESNIWHYNHAESESRRKGYKRIIEHYAREANADLPNAKLFSYMTLYLFFSVIFLFAVEMLNFIFYHGHLQYICICWTIAWPCNLPCIFILLFLVVSLIFFIFACVILSIRLFVKSGEGCKCFIEFSRCLANNTYVLKENWERFYYKKYENDSEYQKELGNIIEDENNKWLKDLIRIHINEDC